MADRMTFEEAAEVARRALEAYQRSETRAEVEDIFVRYGKNGIGYRALCRIIFSHMAVDKALRGYKSQTDD